MDAAARIPSPENAPRLQWVSVGGAVCHVSSFAHLPPPLRPPAACPLCGRPVILKLGADRAHHAAHQPGDLCAVSQPETALHLNMKHYLAWQLRQTSQVSVLQPCAGCDPGGSEYRIAPCDASRELCLAEGWDQVVVEHSIGEYRADVALLRDGRVLAVLEVRATHAVDPEKKKALTSLGAAWAEIEAREDFYQGDTAWTAGQALPNIGWDLPVGKKPWKCAACLEQEAKARRREQIARERQERGEEIRTLAVRFVDFYYPSGKKYREIFRIKLRTVRGKETAIWLERDKFQVVKRLAFPPADGRDILKRELDTLLDDYRRRGALVDSPMDWQPWPAGQHTKSVMAGDQFPRRYEWKDGRWRQQAELSGLSWDGYWENRPAYNRRLARLAEQLADIEARKRAAEKHPEDGRCGDCGGEIDVWWGKMYGRCSKCLEKLKNP